ncbi:hypothetical protein GA0070617_4471 [Micromonospora yangpuensis]|uniref:QsdR TetR regulatory C-terminal domain-containing protein n=1 Tax=Micromonospora yangpuensis TaxID=683228 RepID=A0A1C6V3G9_9ACTN|nr:hypothetical protein GA0070617_4471 [Micromonospora yangpuensis]
MGSATFRARPGGTGRRGDGSAPANRGVRSASTRRVISRETVVRGGSHHFLAHSSIDMDELARTLAVSRATLYRVAGSRDRLLGDVLWWLGSRQLTEARRARRQGGVSGVVEVTRRFADALLASAPLRRFLVAEPEVAARVLFTASGQVHQRFVCAQEQIFREVLGPDLSRCCATPRSVAYLYIRIVESALYAELLAGQQPDFDLAEQALWALLTPAR